MTARPAVALWSVPRWATNMMMDEPHDATMSAFVFGPDHGTVSYSRDVEGGHMYSDGRFVLDTDTREVRLTMDEVRFHCPEFGDDDQRELTLEEARATAESANSSVETRNALVELLDANDNAGDVPMVNR